MVVEFNIPHGKMRIHVEHFFRDAGKMQIQRMLKYLSLSRPDENQVREIRDWLGEQIRREKREAESGSRYPVSWWRSMDASWVMWIRS